MRIFLLGVFLLMIGGGVLWFVANRPDSPVASQAQTLRIPREEFQQALQTLDQQVASVIYRVNDEGVTIPDNVTSSVENLRQATLSAQIQTTPEDLWRTFREEGSQAVMNSLAGQAELSVNNISTEVMNEARYQYCVGVVEQYEAMQSPSTSHQ